MPPMLHCGAREVDLAELATIPTPEAVGRWFPISHHAVIQTVETSLANVGFRVDRSVYALSRDDGRMFATLDLGIDIVPGVKLAAGIRNSTDKSFPLGFCAGHRVFVCDNLAFSAELMVKRKHTRFGHDRFRFDVSDCVSKLTAFKEAEIERIVMMKGLELNDRRADSLMLRAYEHDFISHRYMKKLIEAWRNPTFDGELSERTAWGLFNCFTLAMADQHRSNPQAYAAATMQLSALLSNRDS